MKKLSKFLILFTVICFVSIEIHARKEINLNLESTSHELRMKDSDKRLKTKFYSADSRTVFSKNATTGITFSDSWDDLPYSEFISAFYYTEYKLNNVEMQYQNINERMYDLGTKLSGFSNQLMLFYTYGKFDYSLCVEGLCLMGMGGVGLRNMSLSGDYYHIDNSNSTSCKDAVEKENVTSIKTNCEKNDYDKNYFEAMYALRFHWIYKKYFQFGITMYGGADQENIMQSWTSYAGGRFAF